MRGEPLARARKAFQKAVGGDVERFGRLRMRKARERDEQKSFPKLQRQGSNRAGDRRSAALNWRVMKRLVASLECESPDVPPMKLNETRVGPDPAAPRLVNRRDA